MCGIAGIWNNNLAPVEEKDLKSMARIMAHRGPDDEGFYRDTNIGLAFRRLSIIDLSSAGHQPMMNDDRSLVLVFNGEIYNYPELTLELQRQGYHFRSQSDTEAILHGYEAYGPKIVHHLNGMFAFALYDRRKKILFCARDRVGVKPFYYLAGGDRFLFGSEIKSILAVRGITPAVNETALNEYFTFQNVFTDETLFRDIHLLPAGHTLTVNQTNQIRVERYWDPVFHPNAGLSDQEATEQFHDIFHRAIRRHLLADVDVGSQLSGGLDSATLVVVGSKYQQPFKTFTAGFDAQLAAGLEMNYDERADAEIVSRHVQSQQYGMVIRPGDMERILPRLIWHQEDLRLGNSYPNYYICHLASKFVKVAWSGTGGDELLAGYLWRYAQVENAHEPRSFDDIYYNYWIRLLPTAERQRFFQPAVWKRIKHHDPFVSYRSVIAGVDHLDPLSKSLYFEMKTFLHGLLVIEDKVSSAHGLEVRVPFLDHEIIDFALRLPPHLKQKNGEGKIILRRALGHYLPKEILEKRKQGFTAPEHIWFRRPLQAYLYNTLTSTTTLSREYFQPKYVERILQEHLSGRKNHRLLIWSLLSFEWWLRLFFDKSYSALTKSFELGEQP